MVAHKTELPLTVRSAEITVSFEARLRVARIFGIFFLLFESAIQAAMPPAHHPETAHHKNAARPTPSLPKVNTPKQLSSDCNSIAASISSLVDLRGKMFPLWISANLSMPETFPATASLPFLM